MVPPTDAAAVVEELQLPHLNESDKRLQRAVKAANAFVLRSHPEPTGEDGETWNEDHALGAAMLAANLYRNANRPGVSDNGLGMSNDQAYRRATDVLIEQLLQIERYAPPRVG